MKERESSTTNKSIEVLKLSETIPIKCDSILIIQNGLELCKSSSKLETTIFKQKIEYSVKHFSYLDAR
jgi:hypothetical protein